MAGVAVAGSAAGVGAAARAAAVEAGGRSLFVTDAAAPANGPCERDQPVGQRRECRIAEAVQAAGAAGWLTLAGERTLALVADLVLVIQAHEQSYFDLAGAEVARARGVPVGVVPGPVNSPASCGSNRLLTSGAHIVCSASEALDLLFGVGVA
jgi:DNA processing protein